MDDHRKLHDLCRLRSTLEAFAVNCWRKNKARREIETELQRMMDRLQSAAKQGDYQEFHRIDNQLHRKLIESAGLPSLVRSWEAVVSDLDSWVLGVKETYWPNLMALYQEHVLLLEAWTSKDDWVAEEATHQHLEAGWYRIAMMKGGTHDIDSVKRAVAFISTHFASDLDMTWIARHVSFLSPSHFNRLFKDRQGISPYSFLKQIRMGRAAQLLKSSADPVAVIAQHVGYKNTSHFVRDFRKKFDITPLRYRQEND